MVIKMHDPYKIFIEYVRQCGSQKKAAKRLGISPAYVNDIMQKRKEISDNVASKLGYLRVIKLVKIEKNKITSATFKAEGGFLHN